MNVKKEHGNNNLLMKLNKKLGSKKIIILICAITSATIFFLCNYVINVFIHIAKKEIGTDTLSPKNFLHIDFSYVQDNKFILILYLLTLVFMIFICIKLCYSIHVSYTDMNIGQKGTSRWTTEEEIEQQFKAVPEKEISFPGYGGLPVAHMRDKLYIDDSNTNAIILGITRSGKDEMFLIPSIDLYSRSEEQASMIILDMKMESISRCYNTLVKRGVDVQFLNIENPDIGIQYNPLDLIVKYYKNGLKSDAELLCNSFAYSIYANNSSSEKDQFFIKNAINVLSALIIAHITDCDEEDKRKNAKAQIVFTQKQVAFDNLDKESKAVVTKEYFEKEIPEFTVENLKSYKYIPVIVKFVPTHKNLEKVTMYSIVNTFQGLATQWVNQKTTQLDVYFEKRPSMDRAKAIYSSIEVSGGDKTKGSICSLALTELNFYCYENIAKMTSRSSFDLENIGFGDKPVALFIGVPFYDRSKDSIVSTLIGQIYQANSRRAAQTNNTKCKRKIIFNLNEIGNYPAIKDFKTMLSIGLGVNMIFILYLQTYNQLDSTYGNDANTIKDNCGTHVYIQTSSYETAEHFSKLLGNETITNVTRSGQKLSLNKTITELYDERPLLNPNELMELRPGEVAIKRVMKRYANDGSKVVPYPIFNSIDKGTHFLFSYEYLTDSFPPTSKITDLGIPVNKNLDGSNVYDYNITMNKYANAWLEHIMNSGDDKLLSTLVPKDFQDYAYFQNYFKYDKKLKDIPNAKAILRAAKAQNIEVSMENTLAEFIKSVGESSISNQDKSMMYDFIQGKEKE